MSSTVEFDSILVEHPESGTCTLDEPECFSDLNLDQVVAAMVSGRDQYDLKPLLYEPLHDPDTVAYRQEVFRDLDREDVRQAIDAFSDQMSIMRRRRDHAMRLRRKHHRNRWFHDSARVYCNAVASLTEQLADLDVTSRALSRLGDYLLRYVTSDRFRSLVAEGRRLDGELAAVRYTLHIQGDRVTVGKYESGDDYSLDVEKTFAKFKQGDVRDYRVGFPTSSDMNHVEARILDLAGTLHGDLFSRLDDYCTRNRGFLDGRLARFDREVQFYLAYLDYIRPLRNAGLEFCYPEVSATDKRANVTGGFDLALAAKLARRGTSVVCNDFHLTDPERAIVVTGPNQSGKTTFARMFGQLHYLASLGCPVPGHTARLFLPDHIFTHFEREERLESLRGKLEDELIRMRDILRRATGNSVVVVNEGFTSTTLADAVFIGTEVMRRVLALDMLCVYVTFVDELSSLSEATVSMVATVDPGDSAQRTYEIVRRPADGLAYAAAIAQKYGLTYEALKERLAP